MNEQQLIVRRTVYNKDGEIRATSVAPAKLEKFGDHIGSRLDWSDFPVHVCVGESFSAQIIGEDEMTEEEKDAIRKVTVKDVQGNESEVEIHGSPKKLGDHGVTIVGGVRPGEVEIIEPRVKES